MSRIRVAGFSLFVMTMPLFACTGQPPSSLGIADARLTPCPSSPNCVSSDATDAPHAVKPFHLAISPSEAWEKTHDLIRALPRTRIVTRSSEYVHVECRSRLFGFIDDLELHLRPREGIIAVRSASRLGYSDLGVNRRRVETLRAVLTRHAVIRSVEHAVE